jgi:hypothetical protein
MYTFHQNKTVRCSDQCQEGRWHGMNKTLRTQSKHSITRVFFLYWAKNQNNFPTWYKMNFLSGIEYTCLHLQLTWAFLPILFSFILLTLQGTEITACTSTLPLEKLCIFPTRRGERTTFPRCIDCFFIRKAIQPQTMYTSFEGTLCLHEHEEIRFL